MASYVNLMLDTTGPQGPSLLLNSGAVYTSSQTVTAEIGTTDTETTGYQMKIWGDLDIAQAITDGLLPAESTASTKDGAQWVTYLAEKQLKLSEGDGNKTIHLVIRDDVWNESAEVEKNISYDSTLPIVTVTDPDVAKISKIAGKDTMVFTFSCAEAIIAYKVKVVASDSALESTGAQIPTDGGSINVLGEAVTIAANTPTSVTIKGTDLWSASGTDGEKIIKVFCKDSSGNWSI